MSIVTWIGELRREVTSSSGSLLKMAIATVFNPSKFPFQAQSGVLREVLSGSLNFRLRLRFVIASVRSRFPLDSSAGR